MEISELHLSQAFGWLHLATAVAALIFGGIILAAKKGTSLHKRLGQGYIAVMLPMLTSALMLYDLTGRFNIFHYAAVISSLSLIGGCLPLYVMTGQGRIEIHKRFMYWSVVGVYMALAAETLTRLPQAPFYPMVYAGSLSVLLAGFFLSSRILSFSAHDTTLGHYSE